MMRFLGDSKGLAIILSASTVSCATTVSTGEFIFEHELNESIGVDFFTTDWSRPTGATRREIFRDGIAIGYEYFWRNGCSFVISVGAATPIITGWKYTSEPKLCKAMARYTFGT